ncbi:RNA-directed DNA polymerase, eukaryota, reverse transcriptase zinc-binding domain protein [Tanacetum coccineum]|uniref:RNA-directed DNA polymerase, eukaryota, reverse transcriptase zinc-binding domain protein n=1 Tax=Tanacetum coccineum TaxID=301880 RepID=A0ABQ5BZJ1_9ASTR
MEQIRRSSMRQPKIPNHFNDSVHDLNRKKDLSKNKVNKVTSKSVCKDNADKECLGQDENDCLDCLDKIDGHICGSYGKEKSQEKSKEVRDYGSVDGNGDISASQSCDPSNTTSTNDSVSTPTPNHTDKICDTTELKHNKQGSGSATNKNFASIVNILNEVNSNKLDFVMPDIDEDGINIVKFEDKLVKDGCRKWENTVCGYFVGTKMELIGDEGMHYVVENGPWIIHNKTIIVQQWDPDTQKGISTIASSLGKPIIMDAMTTKMCHQGAKKYGFARVLVEVNVVQGCQDSIIMQYYDEQKVFGHALLNCQKIPRGEAEIHLKNKEKTKTVDSDGFVGINKKRNSSTNAGGGVRVTEMRYRAIVKPAQIPVKKAVNDSRKDKENNKEDSINGTKAKTKEKKEDETCNKEVSDQNHTEENVYEDYSDIANFLTNNEALNKTWNVRGLSKKARHNEVKSFIKNEQLKVYAVLETHIKENNVSKICDKVFDKWEWVSNAKWSPSSCRIIIGWDRSQVKVMVLHSSDQVVFCLIEDISKTFSMLCTFVYARNDGKNRRELWKELETQSLFANGKPWCLMGDFNVTLKIDVHNEGMSCSSTDMIEFQECINKIEVEDLNKSGCHFTWTKSLQNPDTAVIKKLDRILGNGTFISRFPRVQACFLPFIVSDHSQAVMVLPNCIKKRNRAFRFSNYLTEKKEFLPLVKQSWCVNVEGHKMYILVQKLKRLKMVLKRMSWEKGNLTERVVALKEELKVIQIRSIENVHDAEIRKAAVNKLMEYNEAVNDELKLLYQMAKVEWLQEGDRNTAYFHQVIKEKRNTNDIKNKAELFTKQVNDYEANILYKEVTLQEVEDALKSIDDNKAPGPDGYTARFFKAAWEIVRSDVYDAIKEFFRKGKCWEKSMQQLFLWTVGFSICVNGKSFGYFKGGRGLRQGDPISSYLFTIVMEVLNLIIQSQIVQKGNFKYHSGCEELKITNLCFADDLFILCNGDCESVKVIKLALEEFGSTSGLVPNLGKSTMFYRYINEDLKNKILEIVSFAVGKLPVRYLGVLLVTISLKVKDCKCLVDKHLEGILIGFKPFEKWSDVLMIKYLWNVASKKDSLWVKWVSIYRLKGRSLWEIDIDNNASWGWKRLMEKINGIKEPTGPIDKLVSRRQIYSVGFENNAIVASMAQMGQNSLPDDWSKDKNMVNFSINRAWKDLSENFGKVDWCNVVWFSNMIPRHAFIVWLLMLGRLPTQDRISKWHPNKSMKCTLCSDEMYNHEHLFFKCQYADKIWREARIKCQMKGMSNEWKSIIDELIRLSKRNSRIFQSIRKDWKEVWDNIEEVVKMKLSILKVKRTGEVTSAYNLWGIVLS